MRGAGYGLPATWAVLILDAGFTPLGALLAGVFPANWFEPLVSFTAGTFIYVGASDLLPEAHRYFNLRVVLSTLVGATAIAAIGSFVGV